jgi:hypothetical protein
MTDDLQQVELPPLPEIIAANPLLAGWAKEYATDAVLAERNRCIMECERFDDVPETVLDAIRSQPEKE